MIFLRCNSCLFLVYVVSIFFMENRKGDLDFVVSYDKVKNFCGFNYFAFV